MLPNRTTDGHCHSPASLVILPATVMSVSLPTELLVDILTFALPLHPRPADILRTSSQIFTLACHILYTHLRFTSTRQLVLFLSTFEDHSLRCAPRSIDCDIDVVNNATRDVFQLMRSLFIRCSAVPTAEVDGQGRLVVDLLRLRMNSHAQDSNIYMVYEALSQIKYVAQVGLQVRQFDESFRQPTSVHLGRPCSSSPFLHRSRLYTY